MDRDRPGTTWGMNQYWQCSSATGWWDCCCSLRASPSFHLCVWGDLLRISYVLCAWHQITVVSENLIVTHCRGDAVWSYLRGHIMCHVPEQLVLVGWWVFLRETGYFFKENFTRLPLTTPHPVGYLQENKASWDFFSSCRSDPSSAAWLSIECLDFDAYEVAIPLFHTSWTVKVLFNIWVSICINVMESELTFSHLDLSLSLNKDFAW